ncbi:hypothetical protein Mal64_33700 [Pseudobythopirellula maris]|uniref:PEP-CTERM protein-sorting domain-containing protein n=1 Tax=Pseudobythopirellula maris TaxID=2527991 RepID=A0A5C5ZGU7_9BACT|nr:hypothetical protein [Pseudobythopirellula maris]TWT86544.1 hypothetical protein Mal64_33700 [Pseudobythopirellula maris]
MTQPPARRTISLLTLLLAIVSPATAAAAEAHFWLSTSASGSSGPEAPALGMTVGETTTLHLWGRPTTGTKFRNVSLNIVANKAGVDLVDGAIAIHNAIDLSTDRFEYIRDSSSTHPLTSEHTAGESVTMADELIGLHAFTLYPDASLRGVGPTCGSSESDCEIAGDGEPAWRLASFDIGAVAASASVGLYLQLGEYGVNEVSVAEGDYDFDDDVDSDDFDAWVTAFGSTEPHADGNASGTVDAADFTVWRDNMGAVGSLLATTATEVRFGVDIGDGTEPLHNASDDRETNLVGDDPDAVITVSAPSASSATPEPASGWLLALAWLGLRGVAGRRHRSP